MLVEEALKAGYTVIATARNTRSIAHFAQQYKDRCRIFELDVTKPEQIEAVAKDAIAAFGRIDVLVNNAGYGIAGGVEEATEDEFLPVFETNVFGLIRVTRAFLPQFRKQRSGHIINMSSMAGIGGTAGWGYYNATKFAVEGFSEALAGEMGAIGVKVTIVEPGPFRTDFWGVRVCWRNARLRTTSRRWTLYASTSKAIQANRRATRRRRCRRFWMLRPRRIRRFTCCWVRPRTTACEPSWTSGSRR